MNLHQTGYKYSVTFIIFQHTQATFACLAMLPKEPLDLAFRFKIYKGHIHNFFTLDLSTEFSSQGFFYIIVRSLKDIECHILTAAENLF